MPRTWYRQNMKIAMPLCGVDSLKAFMSKDPRIIRNVDSRLDWKLAKAEGISV